MAKIGDERYVLEIIDTPAVETIARKRGWDGDADTLRESSEPEDAAEHVVCANLEQATDLARSHLAKVTDFYGACIIDHQVLEAPHDDRGNLVKGAPTWETRRTFEVATDGERIEITTPCIEITTPY